MLMQYTGRDGDLGLKTNDNYYVIATTDHNRWSICVYIYEIGSTYPIFCPYDTFEGFFMNWNPYPKIEEPEIEEEDDWSDF